MSDNSVKSPQTLVKSYQLIHIISEIMVFVGITFYFSAKTKKLRRDLNSLNDTVKKLEERIEKSELQNKKYASILNPKDFDGWTRQMPMPPGMIPRASMTPQSMTPLSAKDFLQEVNELNEENFDTESNLDAELGIELLELEDNSKKDNLKEKPPSIKEVSEEETSDSNDTDNKK